IHTRRGFLNMATTRNNAGNDGDDFSYLVVRPEKGGIRDVFRCWVWPDGDGGRRFFEGSKEGVFGAMVLGRRWVIVVSILIRKVIAALAKPMEWTGNVVEFSLNLLSMNGNISGLFCNIVRDFLKDSSTQVFILCDKPKDANLILISFRGTEPFDADDWCTDFDYSWYEIPEVGKIHIGFLEALGLGNRNDANSFKVKHKLRRLLMEHKNAKFVVTGHSLGGALAVLFPTVLVLHKEMEIMDRLLGVYTFGQPRVGDKQLAQFMEAHLMKPTPRYFRVVYCNDLVPRLPYDDKAFFYKHFGVCLYYDSLFTENEVDEESNKNFFGIRYLIPEYLNALWELIRSLVMGYTYGAEYREGWFCLLLRVIGLALPGISAHCLTNYIDSVRLGKKKNSL
ncbi:Lipase, partial [Cucurbita argyrosperma subsp. argyrosperma]